MHIKEIKKNIQTSNDFSPSSHPFSVYFMFLNNTTKNMLEMANHCVWKESFLVKNEACLKCLFIKFWMGWREKNRKPNKRTFCFFLIFAENWKWSFAFHALSRKKNKGKQNFFLNLDKLWKRIDFCSNNINGTLLHSAICYNHFKQSCVT